MSRLNRWFALTSVLFLIVLAISPLKDQFQEWRTVRRQYQSLMREIDPKGQKRPIRIQQIWIPESGKTDRCTTCHAAMTESPSIQKRLVNAPEPFRPHPGGVPHDPTKIGCTSCHRGQGPATTKRQAHGDDPFWTEPILPAQYVEAGCGTCHLETDVPKAPVLSQGRQLMEKAKCLNCHDVEGVAKPGRAAPNLDGIGTKATRGWLTKWLKDPNATLANATMPNFDLPDDEVDALVAYLSSMKEELKPLPDLMPDPDRGETRFRESRCISCHAVRGKGGTIAPDLGTIASKTNRQWLYNFLSRPHELQPNTLMPQYHFTEQDLVDIVDYMLLEFVDPAIYDSDEDWMPAEEPESFVLRPTEVQNGQKVFRKYGCAACHETGDEERGAVVIAPELTGIGSKPVDELDFGPTDIPRTLYDWLRQKVTKPRSFAGENTSLKMPTFRFSDEEAQAIVTALLSFTASPPPHETQIKPPPPSNYRPAGTMGRIFDRYRCFSCHEVNGRGGTLADADLSHEGSKVEREWLVNYLMRPFAIKPILEERMPRLMITEEEAQFVADYMMKVYVDDSIPEDIFDGQAPDVALIREGRSLFFDRYGCQACHIVEKSGGYFGPNLDNAPGRLKSGWVYEWLKNPKRLKPKSRQPDFGLSDDDARALTAYVLFHSSSPQLEATR